MPCSNSPVPAKRCSSDYASIRAMSTLVRLRSQANCWTVPKGMLLTLEVLLWLSVTLVKLQEEEKLSILPQGLPTLLLR